MALLYWVWEAIISEASLARPTYDLSYLRGGCPVLYAYRGLVLALPLLVLGECLPSCEIKDLRRHFQSMFHRLSLGFGR